MTELDQRQYRLMLDRIAAFEEGRIPLDALVDDLEGLLNMLSDASPSWRQAFLHEWGKLEDQRGYALFKGLKFLDEEASDRMLAATKKLRQMIENKIDQSANSTEQD
jgi:hypothetical protein